jgi:uncharacterized membrane protein
MRRHKPPTHPDAAHPVGVNVQAIAKLEREALDQQTTIDRVTAVITRVTGSAAFIVVHAVWFVTWMVLNTTRDTFDAYPFQLLNLVVALEAVFLTSVVLMTQNRMAQLADRRAHLDLQINMLAEQELTAMLHMLHGLCNNAGVSVSIRDERVQQLLEETDIHKIAVALDRERTAE